MGRSEGASFTPFRISNAENVSPSSLKTPPKVGVSKENWCNKCELYNPYSNLIYIIIINA